MSLLERFKREEATDRHVNVTPLIDIVFQLLLFFILASNFTQPNQIALDLPRSRSGNKAAADQNGLVISYRTTTAGTEISVNGQMVGAMPQLSEKIKSMADPANPPHVEIRIDKAVPYQEVVTVMDAVRDAGFPKFSLLTLAPSPANGAVNGTPRSN